MKTVAAVGGAILVAGGSVLAIVLTRSHLASFDDSITLGDALVAAGTLALAAVTLWLAWQTRREVGVSMGSIELSREAIELSREGIEAQDMPFIIAVTNPDQRRDLDTTADASRLWWTLDPDGNWFLQVRLWNIGKGPAIARDVRLRFVMRDFLAVRAADVGEIVIGPGQVHDLLLPTEDGEPLFAPSGKDLPCILKIYYGHIGGTEYMTASSALMGNGGVRPSDFTRQRSDGYGRPVSEILRGPSLWRPWEAEGDKTGPL